MSDRQGFGSLFLGEDPAAARRLRDMAADMADAVVRWAPPTAAPTATPDELRRLVDAVDPCPHDGQSLDAVLRELGPLVLGNAVRPTHPWCAAHLHSPTLLSAAAAELAVGATNQSMDSYDQAPVATLVEDHLVRWLARLFGLPAGAGGVLTAGGTASNLLGLLLARDRLAGRLAGLPPESGGWRVVASQAAHFSVQRACAVLGLGQRAVVPVAVDDHGRMRVDDLDQVLHRLRIDGQRVIALVATAGTTDLGAIDPLAPLAERARAHDAWLHVDAAVGSALCLSDRLRPLMAGLEHADSVTADMHKLWWQPIGASALVVRDVARFDTIRHPSDYLDRPEDDGEGVLNLVGRSLDTSRRFDAWKVLVSLRATGRARLAAMVEHLVDTAAELAAEIVGRRDLELLAPPSTFMVVFRWRPDGGAVDDDVLDRVNTQVQRHLFATGQAVVGRTRVHGRVALKLTLVNPTTIPKDLVELIDLVVATAQEADR
jgi:L-2,4-diaminobutyrate decarboxylase